MTASDPRPGGDAGPGPEAPADPLAALLAHLRQAVGAARTYVSVLADEARLRLGGLIFRIFLTLFIVGLAFLVACMGAFYLVVGSVHGLEALIGNRWGAYLIAGAGCLLLSGGLVAGLLRHIKHARLARLRAKYAPERTA